MSRLSRSSSDNGEPIISNAISGLLNEGLAGASNPTSRLQYRAALLFAAIFLIISGVAAWIAYSRRPAVDFLSYWAAGKLVLAGHASAAYDINAHHQVEATGAAIGAFLPFPYPPPFLLVVVPFSLLPYPLGLIGWVAVTAALYILATRRITPLPFSLAQPAVVANALIGQNGFLTCAIFAWGAEMLPKRQFWSGCVLGCMVLKPQLALVIPFALLAGKEWRALAGVIVSAVVLLTLAFLAFDARAYEGFFGILPFYASAMSSSSWPWDELASPFAFARFLGLTMNTALLIHSAVAFVALLIVWRAWRLGSENRLPLLATATMLIPPYLFTYDSLLMAIPLGWLIQKQCQPRAVAFIWLLCLLPVATYFGLFSGPNTIPIAAILTLWVLRNCQEPATAYGTTAPGRDAQSA